MERQYRARLNEQYATLLSALPKELTSSHGNDSETKLSKMEILDLAKKHIATLEKEGEQLEEEKIMLRGQIQLIGRLAQLTHEQ